MFPQTVGLLLCPTAVIRYISKLLIQTSLLIYSVFFHVSFATAQIPNDSDLFIFTVDSTVSEATAPGYFAIPVSSNSNFYEPRFHLYWEEVGNEIANNSGRYLYFDSAAPVLNFGAPGFYRIAIDTKWDPANNIIDNIWGFGTVSGAQSGDMDKLLEIDQWGRINASEIKFQGADRFIGGSATDKPYLTAEGIGSVKDGSYMFADLPLFTSMPGMEHWDTPLFTRMDFMFSNSPNANPNVSNWDTSSVTSMESMFENSLAANPNTSSWDVSLVTSMESMFEDATSANPDTSNWDVALVSSMRRMFLSASAANPDVSNWNTSKRMSP